MSDSKKTPIYVQLAETIKGRILRDEYRPGELLAPARDIEREFGVSAITVRKAMQILSHKGFIQSKQGVGTRIAKHSNEMLDLELSGNFWDWADSALTRHLETKTEVLDVETLVCPGRIAELMRLPTDSPIWRMKRIRKIDGRPASYIVNYALPSLVNGIDRTLLSSLPFLTVYRDYCKVRISSVEQRVRAVVADIDISRKLDIDFGDPVFFVENVYLNEINVPVEVSCLYFRGDRYAYKTKNYFMETPDEDAKSKKDNNP